MLTGVSPHIFHPLRKKLLTSNFGELHIKPTSKEGILYWFPFSSLFIAVLLSSIMQAHASLMELDLDWVLRYFFPIFPFDDAQSIATTLLLSKALRIKSIIVDSMEA